MTSDSASTGKLPTLKENSALPASVSSPTPSNKVPTTLGRAARKSIYRAKVAFPEDLSEGTNLELGSDVVSMQNVLSWKSRSKLGIDLDITAITYDLKGRFSEIIGFDSPTSHYIVLIEITVPAFKMFDFDIIILVNYLKLKGHIHIPTDGLSLI